MEVAFHVEYSGLMGRVTVFFGNSQASFQSLTYGAAFSIHLRGRESKGRLEMHLVETAGRRLIENEDGTLRPAVTFRKQRHRQKHLYRSGGKLDAGLGVSPW
jgi:hypothetical protein